jgi:hypothetical protein
VQASSLSAIAALAAAVALSACATTSSPDMAASSNSPAGSVAQRDLTPQEKKVIVDAVAPSLRNPASAKYKWAKFPAVVTEDTVNYCATVDGTSPYPAYSGHQAYIVEARVTGGHVSGAVMGLIAGGKDFALVTKMCAKYDLDPKNATQP